MSIGIAIAVGDVVLLVADGRQSDAFAVLTDEAQKIVELGASIAVIEFGAVTASAIVVDELRALTHIPLAGSDFIDCLTRSVANAGVQLLQTVIPDPSSDMSRVKIGLLAGGIDGEGAYIGGALFGHGITGVNAQLVRPDPAPHCIVLGGEICGAREYFVRKFERAYQVSGTDLTTLVPMVKRAAKKTIHYAAAHDRSIGGRIQYCHLQRGRLSHYGFL